jgi:hypothetical protein
MIDISEVDWSRMAEPQEDEYDTRIILDFARAEESPRACEIYVPRPISGHPTIFDSQAAIRHLHETCPYEPRLKNGPLGHPNINTAVEYVRRWPVIFNQFRQLIDTFSPIIDTTLSPGDGEQGELSGSVSYSEEDIFGAVAATFFDPIGLAEAFVIQLANNKLSAVGISSDDDSTFLVLNLPGEIFKGQMIENEEVTIKRTFKDKYAYAHAVQLDIKMLEQETKDTDLTKLLKTLGSNIFKLEQDLQGVREQLKVDEAGQIFVDGFFSWVERTIDRGDKLLKQNGMEKLPLIEQ